MLGRLSFGCVVAVGKSGLTNFLKASNGFTCRVNPSSDAVWVSSDAQGKFFDRQARLSRGLELGQQGFFHRLFLMARPRDGLG